MGDMFLTRLRALVVCLLIFLVITLVPFIYKFSMMPSPRSSNALQLASLELDQATVKLLMKTEKRNVTNLKLPNCLEMPVWRQGISDWFDSRYTGTVAPVWTSHDKEISKKVLAWWLTLQGSKSTDMSSISDQIFKLIPDVNPYKVGDPDRCLRCAVVGNSGNLRDSGYGEFIDQHDYILRLNVAMTKGFEKDVGNRTTHRFMYPESFIEVTGETNFVLLAFKPLDIEWLISALTTGKIERTYMMVKKKIYVDPSKIQVFSPLFMHHIHTYWNEEHGRYPSTGMLGLVFALHICDVVNVFGYGATAQGNWDHYYAKPLSPGTPEKKSAFRKTGVHDGDFEADVIKKLEYINKIKVHRGSR
ncbi:CMP-N-acetylneuraminate-beta-galactosamide-alpha-2,3-sialyltransferase 2-like [Ptychodera flava]|uniref:CMP-N-acetylneuraminate-beta-galactosamide- alpha-2,3-sialyltransferase 2-like n=1 Tax=Ptychodera flava TaxID=63121 RepID=UPI003969DF78